MKVKKMIIIGIIVFICGIWVIAYFLIDDVMQKNYNTATPSSGLYDMFIKGDDDLYKYAREVYSEEELEELHEEYDRKVASGVFIDYSK